MIFRCTWPMVPLGVTLNIWIGLIFGILRIDRTWASASMQPRIQQLIAGNGTRDFFGYTVSTSGNALAVGAWKHDLMGAAFVFHRDFNGTWVLAQRLLAPLRKKGDQFGCAVSIAGDVLAIGANRDDEQGTDSGAVYMFSRRSSNTWLMQQKLSIGSIVNRTNNSRFGTSVALSQDAQRLVVGAYRDSSSGHESGSVYIYRYTAVDQFTFEQALSPADSEKGDRFGWAVSIFDDHIAVGAPRHGPEGPTSGAVYAFHRHQVAGSWVLLQKITAADGFMSDSQFGISLALSHEVLAVGSHLDSHNGNSIGAGAVYIFRFSSRLMRWTSTQKLTAMDSSPQDRFGISVALHGTTLAVGAYLDDDHGQDAGSAYLFQEDDKRHWQLTGKYTGPGSTYDNNFGRSVAIPDNDDTLVVGASGTNPSVYVWGPPIEPELTTTRPPCEFGPGYCEVCVSDPFGSEHRSCFHGFGWGLCADEEGKELQYRARRNISSHEECARYAASQATSTGFAHVEGWGMFPHECRVYGPALSGLQPPEWELHVASSSMISKSIPAVGADAEGYRQWRCFRRNQLFHQPCSVKTSYSNGLSSMPCKGGSEIAHGAACVPQCASSRETPSPKILRCFNGTLYPSAADLYCTGSPAAQPVPRSWWYHFISPKPKDIINARVYHVIEVSFLISLQEIAVFSENVTASVTAILFSDKIQKLVGNAVSSLLGLAEQAVEVLQYREVPGSVESWGSLVVRVRVTPPVPASNEASFSSFAAKFRTRFESPNWEEGQKFGTRALLTGFAEVGLVVLGPTSELFSVLKEPESILCDESQITGSDMGYYTYTGCQIRTISGRTCERWLNHPQQLQENGWQVDRDGDHSNCRNPDGREAGRPLVGGPNPQASTGSKHIWCLARDAPGATPMPEFCVPLAFRTPLLCRAPLMATVELGGETMPFFVTSKDWSGRIQEWMAPGDVELRKNGCFQMHPDFQGELSMHCSAQGEVYADASRCEDTVFNSTKGSVGSPGLVPTVEGLSVGACRRYCLELQGECQGFEFARRWIKTDDVDVATFSQRKSQDKGTEITFCTLHASIAYRAINTSQAEEDISVFYIVAPPSRWPEVKVETVESRPEEDSGAGPLPAILGVSAALLFCCGVLWLLRRHCDLASLLDEPEPPKHVPKAPEKPLKCAYCNRGFNTCPALTVHERRCEAEVQEAERIRNQKSPLVRLREKLGIGTILPNKMYARKTEPTIVQVASP
eukprot:gnl/MRDRNA2_/MRDRNA2_65810_c0_seq2.p1 gnl/MRDRNA2_/MRDRNA2_65810_c0~~gnl/MRDRNA2_/MRDRNA2_65810_c0_seq2.p1  ORF type:complete len:1237 (-),score=180.69 gnl/MRDRNA2_/MRDRNA2_65810_c0_seq2:16-3726(-)